MHAILQIFASVVLLICDRESEEIFYKERPVDEEEGEGEDWKIQLLNLIQKIPDFLQVLPKLEHSENCSAKVFWYQM